MRVLSLCTLVRCLIQHVGMLHVSTGSVVVAQHILLVSPVQGHTVLHGCRSEADTADRV